MITLEPSYGIEPKSHYFFMSEDELRIGETHLWNIAYRLRDKMDDQDPPGCF